MRKEECDKVRGKKEREKERDGGIFPFYGRKISLLVGVSNYPPPSLGNPRNSKRRICIHSSDHAVVYYVSEGLNINEGQATMSY
jgi:hypothetical protein